MAYCRNCYKELSFGEIVCTGCGKKIDTPLFSLPDDVRANISYTANNRDVSQGKNAGVQNRETAGNSTSQSTQERKKVYCRNCGGEIDEKAVICIHCGVPTENYSTQGNKEIDDRKASTLEIIGAVIMPGLGSILGLIYYFMGKQRAGKTLFIVGNLSVLGYYIIYSASQL